MEIPQFELLSHGEWVRQRYIQLSLLFFLIYDAVSFNKNIRVVSVLMSTMLFVILLRVNRLPSWTELFN